jgi:RNA-directed DNA polymerase
VTATSDDQKGPTRVAANRPKQVGETRDRWVWVERRVWTERMLAALVTGVRGGKWYSLMDKVHLPGNLQAAWERVRRNKGRGGVDGQSIHDFEARAANELERLGEELRAGTYRPQPVRRTYISKPGSATKRPLGIPTIRDRVAQTALRNVLEPIFEDKFTAHSYGYRPRRSAKDALRRVRDLLHQGYAWVVDADVQSYFDSISHDLLLDDIEEDIADGRVLALVRAYLEQGVMEEGRTWEPEEGTPQGAVISPLLANIYLHPVDKAMAMAGYEMVRYADDLAILCRTEEEARAALKLLESELGKRRLSLHPTKTTVVDARRKPGFDFLGYHFERGYHWPRKKSLKKLKDSIRAKTKRTNGTSMTVIIGAVNRTLRGWFEYFKHSNRMTFLPIDMWVRMRLRSILRKRMRKRGRGRGSDHQRWPNAYFKAWGLFTTLEAHDALC